MHNMDNAFGIFLKDRRNKLDPIALGAVIGRRRTPGLRREEVAQRASVSATWYTWLEQGRGGAPSPAVLERIARALLLTEAEREHLFLLAFGHLPESKALLRGDVTPRLQRILDAFEYSAAFLRTPAWYVVAWNQVAAKILFDYGTLPLSERNIIRTLFTAPSMKSKNPNWERDAHYVVATFRADVARARATAATQQFIDDLCRDSAEFAAIWRQNEVGRGHGEMPKLIHHPKFGKLQLDYSSFSVEGRPDLIMVIYNPTTEADREIIRRALAK